MHSLKRLSPVLLAATLLLAVPLFQACSSNSSSPAAPAAVAPTVSTQPGSLTVNQGASAAFTVVAAGTAPLTYQWKLGTTVVGSNAATYTIAAATAADAGSYTVTISNSAGSVTSSAATLNVNLPPVITTQPTNATVAPGANTTFTVVASGTAPLHYQWKKDGANVGTDSASLAIVGAQASNAGTFTVVVSNMVTSVTSNAVTLTVTGPIVPTGTVTGRVTNFATGAALVGAVVVDDLGSAVTGADGSFTFPASTVSARKILRISAPQFTATSRIIAVAQGRITRADLALLPANATSLASLTTPQTLAVPSSPAQVVLPANGLVTASGGAPAFPVVGNLTPIDPSSSPALMPGDYTTSAGTNIESFGALAVTFVDATGASLNLAAAKTATLRIPVAAAQQGATPPATMPAFYYNEATGRWVQEGTLTLGGTAPNLYYEGTVSHFSYWNADQVYNTTCITGRVVSGTPPVPKAGAVVEAQGRDYIGTSTATTAADGTFTIQVRANSNIILTASTASELSQSEPLATGAVGTTCTALGTDLQLGALMDGSSVKIRLTWGLDPRDLDSHLVGPSVLVPGTTFHVYFSDKGSLTAAPFASLDVDDTSSFGPEVITINRMIPGTYSYSVHHYSGSGTILSSAARVELTVNGSMTVFVPPQPPAGNTLPSGTRWNVFNLVVDAAGNVVVTPVNTYADGMVSGSAPQPTETDLRVKASNQR